MLKITEMSFVEFRKNFSECVNLTKYKSERFLLKRNGKIVGAFVPLEDLEKIMSLAENKETNDVASHLNLSETTG